MKTTGAGVSLWSDMPEKSAKTLHKHLKMPVVLKCASGRLYEIISTYMMFPINGNMTKKIN